MAAEVSAISRGLGSACSRALTSSVQDGQWLLGSLYPHSTAPVLCRAYRVTGGLQTDVLRDAWCAVLDRHEALRTTLVHADGQLWQRVWPTREDSYRLLDLRHATPPQVDWLCDQQASEVLDLAGGPLARMTVIQTGQHDFRIVLVAHQAIADESSMSILVDELSTHYNATLGARPDPASLPKLPCQYVDYARWQRSREQSEQFRRSVRSRARALAAATAPVDLTSVYGSAPDNSPEGALAFDWGRRLSRSVQALAQAEGTTRLAVLLAAFQTVLGRHCGQEQLVVGVPVVVRPHRDFGAVIGPFSNLLPIAGDLSGSPTFRELVRRLDRATREALEHRDVPFPHLIRAVQPERDPHRLPLCHALLTLPDPAMTLRLIGAVVRPLPAADRPTLADLALTVTRLRPSLAGTLRHHHWRVGRPAAAGLHQQLQTLLTAAVDQPDRPIADLPLETPAQLRAAVRAADRIGAARPAQPVHQLVAERAARCPDAAAVDWDGGAISYRDLDARARALATRLRALGDVAGNAVAVRMSSGPWLVAASLAALYAGSHLTWLGPDDAGERGRAVLTDLAPACLLLDDDPARDPLASWFRRECGGRVINLAMLGTAGATGAADCTIDPEQIAYVAYTSGTTGRPKGIAQSHGALAQFVSWMAEALELNDASRVAQWAALEHDPSLCEVFATLAAGGTLCPVPPRIRAHPEKLVDWLARERITMLQTVPSFARELLAVLHDRGSAEPLSALRQLVLMGEALPATLADAIRATLPWTRLTNIYGPTETIAATWHQVVGPVLSGTVPIGRSLPGRQVLVVDEQDQPCPTGIVGEIVVRSPYAVRSYLGGAAGGAAFRPVSAVTDPPVPCYRTGDLGRRRFDGLLEFAGRRDFQVKLAGHRVELAEVEAALADHESVADCAVSAVTDSDGLVERLVAYVAPRSLRHREPATAAQWRAHLRHRFGHAMVRVSFVTVSRIPRNLAGKVDRQRLPDPRRVVEPAPRPRSQLEEAMAGIWSKVLASPPTDVEQTFFAAGGHSSLLPRLVTLIHDQFGVEVPIAACYANPSLAGMSMVVAAAGTRRYATAAERPVEGDRPPGQ